MNYVKTKNKSNIFKENELHIINIIQSSRKNKLENPLNNLLHDYNKEGIKRKKRNKEKLSINSSTGIFRKKVEKKSKSKEKIKQIFSVKSHNNEINIRLSLSENNNSNSYINNTNTKNTTTYEEIIKEKDLLISKLKNEIKINNDILNKIKDLNINNYNKFNLSKTKSSSNISTKNSNKGIFIFTDLINQNKKNKKHTPRYTSRIIMETENVKVNKFNQKKKKKNKRNFTGICNKRLTYHNSDSNLMNFYIENNINQGFLNKDDYSNICSSILEKTKRICFKFKKFYDKSNTINST